MEYKREDWGAPRDWLENLFEPTWECECCTNTIKYYAPGPHKSTKNNLYVPGLCPTCYQKHVLKEPAHGSVDHLRALAIEHGNGWKELKQLAYNGVEVQPITEWSDDLVGKRVVAIRTEDFDGKAGYYAYKMGDKGIIKHQYAKESERAAFCLNKYGDNTLVYELKDFALAPNQDEPEEKKDNKSEPKTESIYTYEIARAAGESGYLYRLTVVETTHSATLKFPNGDIVELPPPEVDEHGGWDSEEKKFWPPESLCDAGCMIEQKSYPDNKNWFIHTNREDAKYTVNHLSGQLIIKEYCQRIFEKTPIILSLTRHTRTYTPEPETEDRYTELEKFPLLNGIK